VPRAKPTSEGIVLMQCPKCGNDNPDDAHACGSCSFILTKPDQERPGPSKGKWLLPVIGVLLVALSAGLVVFFKPTWAFLVALLALCSAITDIRRNWNKRKFKGKAIGAGILVLSCLFMLTLSYLRIDAPPIPNDYTIRDLRSAPPEYDQTYELLGRLTDVGLKLNKMSPIGLSAKEISRLEEINDLCKHKDFGTIKRHLQDNADDIIKLWRNAEIGREILTKLNEFPEIADLSEPSLEIGRSWFVSLRHLTHLHRAYVCLQSSQGNHKDAVDTLLTYESFVRKLSLNARSTITNLVCLACSGITINMANFIINNPETPPELRLRLERSMIPLAREHTSLRNALISEYIICKKEFPKMSNHPKIKYGSIAVFKLNSTLRLYMNFLNESIAIEEGRTQSNELKVWPDIYPNLPVKIDHKNKFPWYYRIYNPIGAKLLDIIAPAINSVLRLRTKLQIHSDLLKKVLDKRLGRDVNLKARAYSDEYLVDVENKKIFSPGPDGKPDTRDDIKLPINPEVLGW